MSQGPVPEDQTAAANGATEPAPPASEAAAQAPEGDLDIDIEVAAAPTTSLEDLQRQLSEARASLDESQARARITNDRLKDTHERLLRTAADLENYKKRAAKEKDEIKKFGIEALLRDFLPVADGIERALEHALKDPSSVIEGLKLVQKQFGDAFGKHGVKGFDSIGQLFDPTKHEALMQQESDAPPNTVVGEIARGYNLNDRLVRPAAVIVAKPKAAATSTPPAADTTTNGSAEGQ